MSSTTSQVDELQEALADALGSDLVLTNTQDMERYCSDWHGDVKSGSIAVIRPRTTLDVSQAVKTCADLNLAIIPLLVVSVLPARLMRRLPV